jgi:hypothetical protein
MVAIVVAIGYYECLYGASGRFRLCRNAYMGIYIRKVDGTVKFILTHKTYLVAFSLFARFRRQREADRG